MIETLMKRKRDSTSHEILKRLLISEQITLNEWMTIADDQNTDQLLKKFQKMSHTLTKNRIKKK